MSDGLRTIQRPPSKSGQRLHDGKYCQTSVASHRPSFAASLLLRIKIRFGDGGGGATESRGYSMRRARQA